MSGFTRREWLQAIAGAAVIVPASWALLVFVIGAWGQP